MLASPEATCCSAHANNGNGAICSSTDIMARCAHTVGSRGGRWPLTRDAVTKAADPVSSRPSTTCGGDNPSSPILMSKNWHPRPRPTSRTGPVLRHRVDCLAPPATSILRQRATVDRRPPCKRSSPQTCEVRRPDSQSGLGGDGADGLDEHLVGLQRPAPPVHQGGALRAPRGAVSDAGAGRAACRPVPARRAAAYRCVPTPPYFRRPHGR